MAGAISMNHEDTEGLQPYLDKIDAMDPVADVPGPVTISSKVGRPFTPTMDALPPEMRDGIWEQVHHLPDGERQKREAELVSAAVKKRLRTSRGDTGLGIDALPYHKELAEITGKANNLTRQIDSYREQLDEVVRHETITDPQTGKAKAQPVMAIIGQRRVAYEAQINEWERQRRLLVNEDGTPGLEGAKTVRKARIESAKLLRQRDQDRADAAEVLRRTEERLREERINKQVEGRLKLLRNEGGQ